MPSPSIKRAYELQANAAAVGFDWVDPLQMLEKLEEEILELREALQRDPTDAAVCEEMGDILFVLVNLSRRLSLPVEVALDSASEKFERRFGFVCDALRQHGKRPEQVSLTELEALWTEAKRHERGDC